ncbi:MAG: hypothetical protein Q9222_002718 [Ikaeria aurantiellina]
MGQPKGTGGQQHRTLQRSWLFNLRTLFLFTKSDFKTVIAPTAIFALSCGVAEIAQNSTKSNKDICNGGIHTLVNHRMPLALVWTWTNLLMEDISNQRLPASILEDAINKPWRPIPSGRVSAESSRLLLLALVPFAFLLAWQLDVPRETAAFAICTWMYNDLEGSSEGPLIRNALNAAGLVSLYAGATAIVLDKSGGSAQLSEQTWIWLACVAAVIVTTVQVQDFADRDGDVARRRKTMPLVYGDGVTRWITAVLVVIWSVVCPRVWRVDVLGYAAPVLLALYLGGCIALVLLDVDAADFTALPDHHGMASLYGGKRLLMQERIWI